MKRLLGVVLLSLFAALSCRSTPAEETDTSLSDGEQTGDDLLDLSWNNDATQELTGNERWVQPPGTARITFFVDDSANQTFQDGEMKWTGSFSWDEETNLIVYAASWLPSDGPYPLLYDDGPVSQGGHEMAGAVAGDHIFSTEVYFKAEDNQAFDYGVLNELDFWMWVGPNGQFTVDKGSTDTIDATGLVLPEFGDIDVKIVVDTGNLNPNFDYVSEFESVNVYIKGSMNMWTPLQVLDSGAEGAKGDDVADDGKYTYVQGLNLGKHTGLLANGDSAQFTVMFSKGDQTAFEATEYKILSEGQQKGAEEGVEAYVRCVGGQEWQPVGLSYELDSWGSTLNTTIKIDCGNIEPECTEEDDNCPQGEKCMGGICKPWCDEDNDCLDGKKCVDNVCKAVVEISKPVIETVSPESGPVEGGTLVTLTGTDFRDGATVAFGVTPATMVAVAAGGLSLTCVSPAHAAGAVSVVITNPDGGTNTLDAAFTYEAESLPPVVGSVEPSEGPVSGGTTVKVKGSNFLPGPEVYFGPNKCTDVFFIDSSTVQVKTPLGVLGAVDVRLVNSDDKEDTLEDGFTYIPNVVDYVKLLEPSNIETLLNLPSSDVFAEVFEPGVSEGAGAGPGIQVQYGYGDLGTDPTSGNWVWASAEYASESGNNDVFRAVLVADEGGQHAFTFRFSMDGTNWTYADTTGSGDGFQKASVGKWTVIDPGDGPYIMSVEPGAVSVSGGDTVTVEGVGFDAALSISLGGIEVTPDEVTPTSIEFVAPEHVPGAADLVVTNPDNKKSVRTGAVVYVLRKTVTPDGDLAEWGDLYLAAENTLETDWGVGKNELGMLYVAFDDNNVYVAWTSKCEATNYILGYLDVDYGVSTGVGEMTDLSDNSGNGDLDDALSNVIAVSDADFGAEFAFGTQGMMSFVAGADLGGAVKVGWRSLSEPSNFPWLQGTVKCGTQGCEAAIPMSLILGGSIPASGKKFALFIRLANQYGGADGLSNQLLPMSFDASSPQSVGEVFVFDVR